MIKILTTPKFNLDMSRYVSYSVSGVLSTSLLRSSASIGCKFLQIISFNISRHSWRWSERYLQFCFTHIAVNTATALILFWSPAGRSSISVQSESAVARFQLPALQYGMICWPMSHLYRRLWFSDDVKKGKGKEEYLYSAILLSISKRSDMDHTVLPANYTMSAFPL